MTLFFIVFCYILGSISFASIIVKGIANKDLLLEGKGNLEAKNASRILGKVGRATVLLLDCLKGYLPLFIFSQFNSNVTFLTLCGFFIILGHNFSLFQKFKGGKGLAAGLGIMLYLNPYLALTTVLAALCFLMITKLPNIAACCAVFLYPILYQYNHRQCPRFSAL